MNSIIFFIIFFNFNLFLTQIAYSQEITSPQKTSSQSERVYRLIKKSIAQNKRGETKALIAYLKTLVNTANGPVEFKDLDQLEAEVDTLGKKDLYEKGFLEKNIVSSPTLDIKQTGLKIYKPENEEGFLVKKAVSSPTLDIKQTGLRIYKPDTYYNGYTLFAHRSLHLRGTNKILPIYLIDMKGDIVYQWMVDGDTVLARLKPNGNLVYISGGFIREIDPQGKPVWDYNGRIDHTFQILEDGNVIIARVEASGANCDKMPQNEGCILNSRVEIISPAKKVLWQWKSEEHKEEVEQLIGSPIIINNNEPLIGINACDILKDNPLAKKDKRFSKRNILTCFFSVHLVAIIDYSTKKIVWSWPLGKRISIQCPHAATMLENGNILLFDNGSSARNWSRIIELNPLTKEIVWEYHGDPKESFCSPTMSNAQRLPNGNTLICVATKNRIFEVTPEGEIVWDFISTFNKIAGTELIYQATRYSPEYVEPLLKQLNNPRSYNDNNK